MIHLLFSADRRFLGEVTTTNGAMDRLTLSQDGALEIGALCDGWVVRGIPVQQMMTVKQADGSPEAVTYLERVQTRSPEFVEALEQWAHENHLAALSLSDSHLACWEMLLLIPLEPSERFAFLLALRLTPNTLLSEWNTCLDEAQLLVRHAQAQTQHAIHLLQKRLAHHLAHVFVAPNANAHA